MKPQTIMERMFAFRASIKDILPEKDLAELEAITAEVSQLQDTLDSIYD